MIWVAALGILVNTAIAWSIGGHHGHDLNLRAAWIHQMGDAASCVGIIVGAVIIHYTGWLQIDPILSIVISLVIVWTAWDIFKDSLNILLEGLPKGLRLTEVTSSQLTLRQFFTLHPDGVVMQPDPAFASNYDAEGRFERGESKGDLTRTDRGSWNEKSWVVGVEREARRGVSALDSDGSPPIQVVILRLRRGAVDDDGSNQQAGRQQDRAERYAGHHHT